MTICFAANINDFMINLDDFYTWRSQRQDIMQNAFA